MTPVRVNLPDLPDGLSFEETHDGRFIVKKDGTEIGPDDRVSMSPAGFDMIVRALITGRAAAAGIAGCSRV